MVPQLPNILGVPSTMVLRGLRGLLARDPRWGAWLFGWIQQHFLAQQLVSLGLAEPVR